MGRSFAIGVACVAWLASATALAEPSWTFVGPVAQGRQFDAVRGPGDSVHLLSSRYYQLSSSGAVLVDEDQGDGRQGALDFPPAIAVGTDGSAHIVTRHGGNFDAGHDIRYRRRSPSGQWDVDVTVGSPVKRNYVVGIAWTPSQVVLTSSEGGTNVWGDLHFWDVTASPQQLGSLGGIWRADCGARLRARGDQVWLATGQPDPDGFATVTFGTAGSGLVADLTQNQKSHKAGTGRRGFPDIYLNGAGQSELVYGAEQTVFFNRYDAQGQAQLPSDQQIFSALGTWHMSLGLAAVAGSDDGKTVLAVALESDGSQQAADSALLWTFSADGGQSWSTPASLGKKTNGGEGRSLPRLVAIGQRFLLLWFDNGSAQVELATIDIDSGVLTDGGAGAGGGAGSGGVGASGGSGASGGASSSGGAGQVGGAGGTTTQGGTSEADDGGCGCRMVPASSSGWLGLALGGCLLALGRRLSWLLRGATQ